MTPGAEAPWWPAISGCRQRGCAPPRSVRPRSASARGNLITRHGSARTALTRSTRESAPRLQNCLDHFGATCYSPTWPASCPGYSTTPLGGGATSSLARIVYGSIRGIDARNASRRTTKGSVHHIRAGRERQHQPDDNSAKHGYASHHFCSPG